MISQPETRTARPHPRAAFTLIELIAVMAIIAIMLALLAPAVGNFQSTAGRNGAVNILMNTMEQARVLGEIGCDFLQGYAFARPMPAQDLEAWAQRRSALVAQSRG